jgi:nucleoside transporter
MIQTRLSIMMFLQFFVWGSWFVTLGLCLGVNGFSGTFIGESYGSAPIAAIIAPLFLGLIADRFFSSERVMGLLFLLGAVFMWMAYGYAVSGDGKMMVWMFIGHMLCYMPSLGLSNTITFTHIPDQNDFPRIRVWGTIGWIVAGLFVGFMGWSASLNILKLAAISSAIMGLYCFMLPHTPPPAKDKPVDIRTLFMLDAIKLLGRFPFLVFIVCSTLICIPLAYYYGITSQYLGNVGFVAPAASMSIGQMSEIIFMLLIPFFFRRMGVKWMILVGMLAWVTRYALFAMGAEDQVVWMLFLAIALHGICYDFFFVTGFMYTDNVAGKDVRGQAQGMLVFFTQGVGMYFGYMVAFGEKTTTVTRYGELTDAIKAISPEESGSFLQHLLSMFSVVKPKVDPTLLAETMAQWKTFWWLPTIMAAVVTVVFFLLFWGRMKTNGRGNPPPEAESAEA